MVMTDEQIADAKRKLSAAFEPLICKVEDWDYRAKLRFKILDEMGDTIVEVPKVYARNVIDQTCFVSIIEQAREMVQAKGHILKKLR